MAVQLSIKDVNELKKQGYSESQIQDAILEVEREDMQKSSAPATPFRKGIQSAFSANQHNDLVRWQLELNDILERAEHILRGDVVRFEGKQIFWDKNPKPEENCLNEFGVQLLMKIISTYINRNTILSDYETKEINEKVFDFGRTLNNLVFKKYEEMGMDTEDKRKEYSMLIRFIVDIVHSSYKRALMGGERRSLREMIQISQSSQMLAQGGMTVSQQGEPQKARGILNPMRYIAGKYV